MQKKLKLALIAAMYAPFALAQINNSKELPKTNGDTESAFTFTEAQLGEDDDMSQNVSIVNSNNNLYANQVGYLFSPMRFKYRGYSPKYNSIYINGTPMNNAETGQFNYSIVGGLNNQTRDIETSLPFESNNFTMSTMGGSDNYN